MSDFGSRLIRRLEKASSRNQQVINNNKKALRHLDKIMPVIDKTLQGNEIAMAAIREVYGVLEADAEELSTTKVELREAKNQLEMAVTLLEQAGFDFANIQQFSNDEIWLGDHLPTIKRALDIFNIPKLEVALDEMEKERFEDIAHAVKRSGQKREKAVKE